jgi:peptidoglycan/xylan/chitin deacetylase (PgdA/CDA1 family)
MMTSKVPQVKPVQRIGPFSEILATFVATLMFLVVPVAQVPTRTVAVTIDDLPGVSRTGTLEVFRQMNASMLRVLRSESIPAIGFVNEGKLAVEGEREARTALLADWLDAGMALGNHTYSHGGLTNTPVAQYERDVLRGEAVTRPLVEARGQAMTFFRHPMTQTGPTAEVKARFDRFLADHGYQTAPFTIEDADYMFALVYDDAVSKDDQETAGRLRQAYLEHQLRMFEWFELLSRETFNREIPQILLIHVNRMNGDSLGEAVATMQRRGYRFVSLETALADPAYQTADGFVGRFGPSWLHRWRISLDMPNRLRDEPDPPVWVQEAYARLQ